MARKNFLRNRIRVARRMSDRNAVIKFAKDASRNAKRSSTALNLEYNIIKDGFIYKIAAGEMVKISALPKVEVGKSGLTKGSKIYLK